MSENRPKRARILIPILVVLAVSGAAFGGYAAADGPDPEGESQVKEETPPEDGDVVEVGELTVSLAGPESHHARVGLAVVLAEGTPEEEVADKFPLLKEAALLTIADSSPGQLRSRAGLETLRTTLSDIATDIYPDGGVLRVILVEAIIG